MQEMLRIDLNGVNCYLGKENGNCILFDTGGHLVPDKKWNNRYDSLQAQLKALGCTPDNLKLIVLTHGDNDHAANAVDLKKHYNVKIAIHKDDRVLVENPDIDLVMKSFNYRSLIFKLVFKIMNSKIKEAMIKTLNEYKRFTPDILLNDGDVLDEYGFKATVHHLPGHTAGSIAVLTENGEFIAGDIFANNKKPEIALNACDFTVLKESVNKIKSMKIKIILPGHGNPFPFDEIKL